MRRAIGGALAALVLIGSPASLEAQDRDGPGLAIAGFANASLREGASGFGLGHELRSYSARATLTGWALQPWVQVEPFDRPELDCGTVTPCNDRGVLALVGLTLPLTETTTRRGLHPRLAAGVGYGFSEEDALSHFIALGFAWVVHPAIAPALDFRFQRLPGLRAITMLSLGLEARLF